MTDLILDKNSISSLTTMPILHNLETLWLNNNDIADLETLCNDISEKVRVRLFCLIRFLSVLLKGRFLFVARVEGKVAHFCFSFFLPLFGFFVFVFGFPSSSLFSSVYPMC